MTAAATERELLRSLPPGKYTLDELYAAVERANLTERANGHDIIKGKTDTRWKHRVRGGLQGLKANGQARPLGDQVWHIEGTPDAPVHAVMVSLDGTHRQVELRLQRAADLLADLDEPADLVLADPPYGLGVGADEWGRIEHAYGRDSSRVVGGYEDVPAEAYADFTAEWIGAAAPAVRPGGHLVVVTGTKLAARVQVAAEDAGLTFLNSIAAEKAFPLHTRRRYADAHYRVTVLCRGPERNPARVFNVPDELPKAKTGGDYPRDVWPASVVGRSDARPGELRYQNSLPEQLVSLILRSYTRPAEETDVPDHVVDPFLGGGTTALVCALLGLRFTGGDVNPRSLAFAARRISARLMAPARPRPVRVSRPRPTGAGQLALI